MFLRIFDQFLEHMLIASIGLSELQSLLTSYTSLVAYHDQLNALGLAGLAAIVWAAIVLVMLLIMKIMGK